MPLRVAHRTAAAAPSTSRESVPEMRWRPKIPATPTATAAAASLYIVDWGNGRVRMIRNYPPRAALKCRPLQGTLSSQLLRTDSGTFDANGPSRATPGGSAAELASRPSNAFSKPTPYNSRSEGRQADGQGRFGRPRHCPAELYGPVDSGLSAGTPKKRAGLPRQLALLPQGGRRPLSPCLLQQIMAS